MKINSMHSLAQTILILLCIPVFGLAQKITFTFNPPDSTESHVYLTEEEIENFMMEETITNRVDQYEESYFRRDSNFILSGSLLFTVSFINGEKQEANMLSPMVGMTVDYIIDRNGRLDSLDGYSAVRDSITLGSQSDFAEAMPHYWDYEPFFIRISSEWKNQIGDFVGKTFEIGDTLHIVDTVNNIEGTSYITKKVWFAEMQEYAGTNCVVIEYEHSIDLDYSEMYTETISQSFSDPDYDYINTDIEILGDHTSIMGRQIMDPSTMLIYYTYEESTQVLQVSMYGGLEVASQKHTIEESRTDYKFK